MEVKASISVIGRIKPIAVAPTRWDDERLEERLQAGAKAANKSLGFALTEEDLEDAAQNAVLSVIKQYRRGKVRLDGNGRIPPEYAFRAARNAAITIFRTRRRNPEHQLGRQGDADDARTVDEPVEPEGSAEEVAVRRYERIAVIRVLRRLRGLVVVLWPDERDEHRIVLLWYLDVSLQECANEDTLEMDPTGRHSGRAQIAGMELDVGLLSDGMVREIAGQMWPDEVNRRKAEQWVRSRHSDGLKRLRAAYERQYGNLTKLPGGHRQ